MDDGEGGRPLLKLTSHATRTGSARASRTASAWARASSASARSRRRRILLTSVPARLHPDHLRPGRGAAAQHHRAARPLRGRGQGGDRAGVVPRRSAPIHQLFLDQLMECIGVVLNMIGANMRTEELLQQSQSLTAGAAVAVEGAHAAAGRAQAPQRGAREAGAASSRRRRAARGAEHEGRGEEPRGRARPRSRSRRRPSSSRSSPSTSPSSSRTCRHELRTPLNSLLILAKMLADNKDENLTDEAGRVREDDLRVGRRSARRSSTRSSTCRRSRRARCRSSRATSRSRSILRLRRADVPPGGASRRSSTFKIEVDRTCRVTHPHRPAAAAADPEEPARQRVQVHRARRVTLRVHRAAPKHRASQHEIARRDASG